MSQLNNEVAILPAAVTIFLYKRLLIRAFSDVEKPFFLFSDLTALTAKSEYNKGFSMSEKARISRMPS